MTPELLTALKKEYETNPTPELKLVIEAEEKKDYRHPMCQDQPKENDQTAVEWFYDKIKSHFEHDGDLLETLTFTMAIAKQKEREQIKKLAANDSKPPVSGAVPIEEVALHAADDWFDTAKFRSDVRADLKSYYEGFRDAMRFCRGNDR